MCYFINIIGFCEYVLILNWKPATHFKQIVRAAKKTGNVVE